MNRRSFLVRSALLGAAGTLAPVIGHAARPVGSDVTAPARHFTVSQTYQLRAPTGSSGPMRLWIPVPENHAPFQLLRDLKWEGDFQAAHLSSEAEFGVQSLFVHWDDCQGPMNLSVQMAIDTRNWDPGRRGLLSQYQAPADIHYPAELSRYLQGSRHIKIDGIVKDTADQIVGTEQNPLTKARLIHDWVAANMERDNSVIGCGVGDVGEILTSGKLYGKCTDINSVFVALARAAGLPAREMFGIRLGAPDNQLGQYSSTAFGSADASGHATITDWQHCRAQFWLANFGWVPCDPADVTKMRLAENKTHADPAVQAVNEDLFGNWDMNWVGFNVGRDFVLHPTPDQAPLNNFGYPYAEAGGDPLDYYDFARFSYAYQSVEQL